ncbi:MAG: VWA domain-containing protein [Porticoccaceae bacterium]
MFDGTLLEQFHFLRPLWLLALIAVAAIYGLLRRSAARGGQWHKVIAPALLPLLLQRRDGSAFNLRPWLVIAGCLAVVALAGPTWSKKAVPVHKQEQVLLILFDLSPSMLATDIKPDRLTRARLKTIDLLSAYREGFAALVVYAGDAHVVTPLSDDTNTIISQLPVLHPAVMPAAGSNVEAALAKALELAANAAHQEGDILLVTDGVTADARENLHRMMRDNPAFRLSVLGVGSDDGAPVPLNEHGFARDGRGSIVIASLGSQTLRGLAQHNGGVYRTLSGTDADIQALLKPLQERAGVDARELERNLDVWEDRGFWLMLPLLPLALLLFRRGLVVAVLLLPLLHAPQGEASWWDDLWLSKDQQGYREMNKGDPDRARELFADPAWQGIAAAEAGAHDAAAQAFAGIDSADAHYNRGNALARAGKLDEAIAAYDEALARAPDMEDAIFNKALVESLKNQQSNDQSGEREDAEDSRDNAQGDSQQGEPDQGGQQGGNDNNDGNEEQDTDGAQAAQNGDSPQGQQKAPPQGDGQAGDDADAKPSPDQDGGPDNPQAAPDAQQDQRETDASSLQEADQAGDAAQQNAQQWLRRVPDDPGGLLRNKFEYEARQRFREERSGPRLPPGNYSEERW